MLMVSVRGLFAYGNQALSFTERERNHLLQATEDFSGHFTSVTFG